MTSSFFFELKHTRVATVDANFNGGYPLSLRTWLVLLRCSSFLQKLLRGCFFVEIFDENFGEEKEMAGIVGKPIARPSHDVGTDAYLPAVIKGIGVTMKHFFNNTKELALGQRNDPVLEAHASGINTISYPEQKRPYPTRFRGLHRLTLRDDGAPRCVACLCCSTACPAQCIHIVAGEYAEGDERRGYERYPVEFVIDELRCIFCGFCVEACPCDAIRMDTGQHPVPYDSREQFIYGRELLMGMADVDGRQTSDNPRREPAGGFAITREQSSH